MFCSDCRTRLAPTSSYDLTLDDYAYRPDRDAIAMMKATGILPYLVKNLAIAELERKLSTRLSSEAHKVTYPTDLDALVRDCAISLSLDVLPEVFIIEGGQPNAFTFGTERHACVVANSTILGMLDTDELRALFAHELGHVKSGHMLYHTLAEVLGHGISLSASFLGLNIISLPVRLALLSWHRESEVTADRASLLVVNEISVIRSFMTKLALWHSRRALSSSEVNIEKNQTGVLESASELFRTHPLHANRFKLAKEFAESKEFLTARRKVATRLDLLRALIPVCRFCAAKKPIEALFCPSCEKSQI